MVRQDPRKSDRSWQGTQGNADKGMGPMTGTRSSDVSRRRRLSGDPLAQCLDKAFGQAPAPDDERFADLLKRIAEAEGRRPANSGPGGDDG